MNIVHELNQLEYGGVEKVIRNIIKYDDKNHHTVIVRQDGPFRQELEKVGAEIIFTPKKGESNIDFCADLFHIHSGGTVSELAISLGKAFPVIETIHSPIRSPMGDEYIRQRVGVTNTVCRMNSNCIPIYNGIDLVEPDRYPEDVKRELGIPEGVPIVGRLGRIGKDKCMEEWILTCYYLQQQGLKFAPLIVGGEAAGLDGYVGKLKLMAASLPVKGIIWAGHHADVANYLQVMDVFLYPSPTEGFGLVFAEAMYAGPVVVSYKNDVTLEVAGGFSVLTEQSIKGLAEGVTKALDIHLHDTIAPMARELVQEQFGAERMAKDYQDVYLKIFEQHYQKN